MRQHPVVRGCALVFVALLASTLAPSAAGAASFAAGSLEMGPSPAAVGEQARQATITITNVNTPPDSNASEVVTGISLAPSCGTGGPRCNAPDPGVFALSPTASGLVGACAGFNFVISAPDPSGVVTITSNSQVVLGPPGQPNDHCILGFSYSVTRAPSADSNPGTPGLQTSSNLVVDAENQQTFAPSNSVSSVETTVRVSPALSTQASRSSGTISDTAALSGPPNRLVPTGTVTFQVWGPNNATCAGPPVQQSTNSLSNGSATSSPFAVIQPGTYRYVASYSGDVNYVPVAGACNDPGENVSVTMGSVAADFDGNGTTDISVFRPSTGQWFVRNGITTTWGAPSDVPVPGDYDGNRTADVAVYRPSTGEWFVRNGVSTTWGGTFEDLPVPGDYDGNGTTDIAIFRPPTGQWFVRNGPTITWGASGDVPVPADYDGNGTTDIAVFRRSTGQWFVRNGPTITWGAGVDLPVPGDYDSNGTTDVAVYRPSTGEWFVRASFTVAWGGTSGDVPVPGDYDGNGSTDVAVFRPSTGQWFVRNGATTTWGASGDRALPLPGAIHATFFP